MNKKKVLLIGGAGYVGSVTAEELAARGGYEIYVLDNLYEGHREAVHPAATFLAGTWPTRVFSTRFSTRTGSTASCTSPAKR